MLVWGEEAVRGLRSFAHSEVCARCKGIWDVKFFE